MPSDFQRAWAGLPAWGRVAVVCVPILIVLFVGAALLSGGIGHSESWQYGYDHAGNAASLVNGGVSNSYACRSVAGMGGMFDSQLDQSEAYDGCMAGLKD
ncbi:hypothetical protein [Mycolicibacterium arenosum]|uniref:DUF732 domain-containing protein n=1 Tax=Mycolicibacterium arenosum TaxID=2952157 RepID=A0ABT1M0U7_9MYCO|nr:hypothetical protein [Mycolicibacterium sp. CAU 1645]MCP9272770.1 hypothetical protein [Mycolicibacterium sp. CAU 1645]